MAPRSPVFQWKSGTGASYRQKDTDMTYPQALSLLWLMILGIVLVPGMDMILTLSQSLARGSRAGLAVVAGIIVAGTVHTAWGVAAAVFLLTLPPVAIALLLAAGAGYLGWIGLTLLRSRITLGESTPRAAAAAFRQGALTDLANPKAYAFVASVYPQFVRPEFGPVLQQGLVIGLLVALTQGVVYGAVALAAGRARGWLLGAPRATILIGKATGALMLAAAVAMLVGALTRG
jgi:threonine/homoserine/homoserine lactone efflux protein